jgi:hypothetical protein
MWLTGNIQSCRNTAEKTSPDEGLEPLTLGLKVPRSTDWANRAYIDVKQTIKVIDQQLNWKHGGVGCIWENKSTGRVNEWV